MTSVDVLRDSFWYENTFNTIFTIIKIWIELSILFNRNTKIYLFIDGVYSVKVILVLCLICHTYDFNF